MEDRQMGRIMPNNLEAEQSVVGSMIADKEAITIAMEIVTKEDFYHQQYAALFDAITTLHDDGIDVDPVILKDKLQEMGVPPEVSSTEFIIDVVTSVPTTVNVASYANIVKDKAILRRIISTTQEIENNCYLGKDDVSTILDKTEKDIFKLTQHRSSGEYVPIKDVVMNSLKKIEMASKLKGTITGLPTGFTELDYKTAGLQPSDLILIAARPSMGKTAFVLNLAQYICFHENACAAVFSLEMSAEQLVNRMLALESGVEANKIRTGDLQEADWERLSFGAGVVGKSSLIIDDTPGISIGELRSKCRKYKMDHDLKIIIIDYIQLMTGTGHSESRQQEVSEISRSLKSLARELNVPVIALSQLSRAVEKRDDKRPMMSDLRESGGLEQDADVVMFIYREDYYDHDTDRKNISEIIIAKQRNGPIGTVELAWIPELTKFGNLDRSLQTQE
ncbi:MAG: replicative DNA helicase [Lachnospiraceae bacterium]|jgi:replicative DNA helicase|nr:replicative DNA helicase [Lachnospiraceae bacterium]MBQ1604621.1 replicative DNA helicase [Lachnospiraceae bacterium]MBQ4300792.1 replicative DNA helicase [Lachnospiraceae bacterium]